jgi:hypothetical protein
MTDFNLKDNVETIEEANFEQNVDLMKNRRKMTFFSLYAITLVATVLMGILVFKPEILVNYIKIESTVSTIVLGWFSVIALYFGAASLADIFGNKTK